MNGWTWTDDAVALLVLVPLLVPGLCAWATMRAAR